MNEIGDELSFKAMLTAAIVLIVSVIIIIFINLSNSLYLPNINKERQITRIIMVQNSILTKSPKG
mgnify:CR=1 FL=1